MRLMPGKPTLVFLFSISILVFAGALRAQEKSGVEKVRIAVATSSLAFLVPFVAKDHGLYPKHGSDVELIQMRPNIAMAALLSGDIDYAELIGSVIRSAARGLPVRAISTGIKAPFFSIVAQNKYKSMKDLKGAVIGLASIGGTNHISTRLTLRQFGLDPDKDVKFLAIGDEKLMYDAFKIGRVESIVVAPPFSVFSMDEKLARESYDVVVNAFSRDGRVPLDGVDILLQIEKDAKQIPPTVTPQMVVDSSLIEETLKEMGSK